MSDVQGEVLVTALDAPKTPVTPEMVTSIKLDRLHTRVDKALQDNRRTEMLVILLCTLLFATGLGLFLAGYVAREPLIIGSGVIVEIGIIWPIMRILSLRKENIQLSLVADMIDLLPQDEAIKVWKEWFEKWFS